MSWGHLRLEPFGRAGGQELDGKSPHHEEFDESAGCFPNRPWHSFALVCR